jgi:cardiolipin synthase
MKKNIPNILTISRFVLIPFIVASLLSEKYILAIILLSLSAITDILDGFIARKFNIVSNFGKLIDPLADKSTQVSILVTLVFKNIIPLWILVIIFVKELLMISGASFLYGKDLVVSSRWYGKLSTIMIYLAMVSSFIINWWNKLALEFNESIDIATVSSKPLLPQFDMILYIIAILATIFSLIMYWKDDFRKKVKESK